MAELLSPDGCDCVTVQNGSQALADQFDHEPIPSTAQIY
jgi:hypothetical protein